MTETQLKTRIVELETALWFVEMRLGVIWSDISSRRSNVMNSVSELRKTCQRALASDPQIARLLQENREPNPHPDPNLAEALRLLKPFGDAAANYEDHGDWQAVIDHDHPEAERVTVGHLRKVRTFLAKHKEGE